MEKSSFFTPFFGLNGKLTVACGKIFVFYTIFWPEWKINCGMWKNLRFLHRFWPEWKINCGMWKNVLCTPLQEVGAALLDKFYQFLMTWHIVIYYMFLTVIFYVMMILATLYKPNINAEAKHISCVLLKFSLFFGFVQTYFVISWAVGVRF